MKRFIIRTAGLFAQIVVTATLTVVIVQYTAKAQVGVCPPQDPAGCDINVNPECYSIDFDGSGGPISLTGDIIGWLNFIFLDGPGPQVCLAQSQVLTPAQLQLLRDFLPHMSVEFLPDGQGGTVKTLRFSGLNIQIVNGLGATNGNPADPNAIDPVLTTTNALGNLIVGYAELGHPAGDDRTGSHNVVAGFRNNYSSFGGLVVAQENAITGAYASVSGGVSNTASGPGSSVSGGGENSASGPGSTISGGGENTALAFRASVSGGFMNAATDQLSSVSGGIGNQASSSFSSISGGADNTASGLVSSVSGGTANVAAGNGSSINGGLSNETLADNSSVSGGTENTAGHEDAVVSGGCGNSTTIDCDHVP